MSRSDLARLSIRGLREWWNGDGRKHIKSKLIFLFTKHVGIRLHPHTMPPPRPPPPHKTPYRDHVAAKVWRREKHASGALCLWYTAAVSPQTRWARWTCQIMLSFRVNTLGHLGHGKGEGHGMIYKRKHGSHFFNKFYYPKFYTHWMRGGRRRIVFRPSSIRKTQILYHHLKTKTTKKEGLNTSPDSTVHAETGTMEF